MTAFLVLAVTASPALAAEDVIVLGHRGTAYRPENTRESLENAAKKGVDWVEIDFRCTRTGVPVAMHDATLDRTTTGTGRIDQRTWGYVSKLKAEERWPWYRRRSASYDGQFRIPTLKWMINRAAGANVGLWVSMKVAGECEERVLNELQAADDAGRQVIFAAATIEQLQWAAANYSVPLFRRDVREPDVDTSREIDELVEETDAVRDIRGISARWDAATPELIAEAKAAGLTVCVWTFRAQHAWLPQQYHSDNPSLRARGDMAAWVRSYTDQGVDCIIADEPNHTGLLP